MDQLGLAADEEEIERLARSKREDLLKMHAYRDAIRRSAGAYVLYPGDHHQIPFTEHHEVLPSLGAFVLRPAEHETLGTSQLEQFLRDVLDHVADQEHSTSGVASGESSPIGARSLRTAQLLGYRVLGGRRPMHSSCAATCEVGLMPRGSIAAGYTTFGRVIGKELFRSTRTSFKLLTCCSTDGILHQPYGHA